MWHWYLYFIAFVSIIFHSILLAASEIKVSQPFVSVFEGAHIKYDIKGKYLHIDCIDSVGDVTARDTLFGNFKMRGNNGNLANTKR